MQQLIVPFGTVYGREASLYYLTNEHGMTVALTDLGACIVRVVVPDAAGNRYDVALGFAGAAAYTDNPMCVGAVIGRCANRTKGATFELAGTTYRLSANEGKNNNHSGPKFWHERLWQVVPNTPDDTVAFTLRSQAGDQGFPGAVNATVTYKLTENNELRLYFEAHPSQATIINMATHCYWNLNGHASGSVLDHTLTIDSAQMAEIDNEHIPTGALLPVAGTPFDFAQPRTIGSGAALDLDHAFALTATGHREHAARLVGNVTGITLDLYTTAPSVLAYAGGAFNTPGAKDGATYGPGAGLALEPQHMPDAIHHKEFDQPVFVPNRPYLQRHIFAFGTTA